MIKQKASIVDYLGPEFTYNQHKQSDGVLIDDFRLSLSCRVLSRRLCKRICQLVDVRVFKNCHGGKKKKQGVFPVGRCRARIQSRILASRFNVVSNSIKVHERI